MSTPWTVSCAECGCFLAYAFDTAPHQLYCADCALKPEEKDEPDDADD